MRIHPADPPPVKPVRPREGDNICMRNGSQLVHQTVEPEQFPASPGVPDQQLAVDQNITLPYHHEIKIAYGSG